jgi:hypothetical protein
MLLMFVVSGVGSLGWMLVLGAVMAVEKNIPWGRRISAPLGVVLIGCGLTLGTASALQLPDETAAELSLTPTNSSSVSGTTTFTNTAGGVEVELDTRGLPEPGATYLAHIHPGSCASEPTGGDEDHSHGHHVGTHEPTGEIEHPLTPIVSDPEGNGSSTTVIDGATVGRLFSGDPEFYVNVHAESSGSEELSGNVACGDLGKSG